MMLENEHVQGVQTPPRKSYNPFDSDDEDTNAYTKSSINEYDLKSFETTAASLAFHLDSSDLSWEDAILQHSGMLSSLIAVDANSEEVICRKDTELFTEKTIPECGVQKFVSSCKENGFNSVKDIWIDEGVPNDDKDWIKNQDNHDSKDLSDLEPDSDVVADLPLKEGLRSRPNNDIGQNPTGQAPSKDDVKNGFEHDVLEKLYFVDKCKTDLVKVDEFSNKEIEPNSSWLGTDLVKSDNIENGKKYLNLNDKDEEECHKLEKTSIEVNEQHCNGNIPLQDTEEYPAKPLIEYEVEAKVDSNENQSEEVTSILPGELPAIQEPIFNGVTNTLPYDSKGESGSIVLDFNAGSVVTGKEKEAIPEMNEEVEKHPETQTMSTNDGGASGQSILDDGTDKRVHGETSFSAALPLPASITFLGPHTYNGNVSHRSESSTGSTRSFAFPVLQAEWNSSPVRMKKADKRQFRKQRGWVYSLICCKF